MSKNKKNRNHKRKAKLTPRLLPKQRGPGANIVPIQTEQVPRGAYLTEEDAMNAGKALMEDLNEVFKKHQILCSFGGGLTPIVEWGDAPNPDGTTRKAWKLKGVLATKVTSQRMSPDAPMIEAILQGASQRVYGAQQPAEPQPMLPGMPQPQVPQPPQS